MMLFKREYVNGDGEELGVSLTFWCPGCKSGHTIYVGTFDHDTWTWNGDENKPTFNPSVLHNGNVTLENASQEWIDKNPRCHSFVRDGMIQYLSDSGHALAGLTVPMEPLPRRYQKFLKD